MLVLLALCSAAVRGAQKHKLSVAEVRQPSLDVAADNVGAATKDVPQPQPEPELLNTPPAPPAPTPTEEPKADPSAPVIPPPAPTPTEPKKKREAKVTPIGDDGDLLEDVEQVFEQPMAEQVGIVEAQEPHAAPSTQHLLVAAAILAVILLIRAGIYYYTCKGRRRADGRVIVPHDHGLCSFAGIHLCNCICAGQQPHSFCEACCFPDMLWAEMVSDKLNWMSFPVSCCLVSVLMLLKDLGALLFCCIRCFTRRSIRDSKNQPGPDQFTTCFWDCVASCCCWGAAQYQESEFVEVYDRTHQGK